MSDPMMPPPPTPPPPAAPPPPPAGGAVPNVDGPAVGLIVTAVVGALFSLFSLFSNALGFGMSGLEGLGGGDGYSRYMSYFSGGAGIFFSLLAIAIAGFILWGAMQMRARQNWNMAMAASVVAMIPCISPCCVLGLPIGIWSVVTLVNPQVKATFH